MYRYHQSLDFKKNLKKYEKLIDEKSINNFLKDLSGAPRSAKKAHSLHGFLGKINMWAAHFTTKSRNFFTVLYLICDEKINSCPGNSELCKSTISSCNKPSEQIFFVTVEKGEPYPKLSSFYTE